MEPLNLNGMAAACRDFARLLKPESPDDDLETLAEIIGKGINKAYEDDPVLFPGFLERLIRSNPQRKRLFLKIESVCKDFVSHATPDDDKDDIINLMEDITEACIQNDPDQAGKLAEDLEEILFYIDE